MKNLETINFKILTDFEKVCALNAIVKFQNRLLIKQQKKIIELTSEPGSKKYETLKKEFINCAESNRKLKLQNNG